MAIRISKGRARSHQSVEELEGMLARDMERLSPAELETFQLMLKELEEESVAPGQRIIDMLGNAEYRWRPVDIETFINDPYFLGHTCSGLYPKLQADMKALFEGDYTEVILGGSVGWGKCGHLLTCVTDGETGERLPLRDLIGKTPLVPSFEDGEIRWARAAKVWHSGWKEGIKLTLASGQWIKASCDHPMLTPQGYRKLEDLVPGDFVACARYVPAPLNPLKISDAEVQAIACLLADGGLTSGQHLYCKGDLALVESFSEAIVRVPGCRELGVRYFKRGAWYQSFLGLGAWLDRWGLKCLSKEKRVPSKLFGLPDSQLSLFLRWIFTDGNVYVGTPRKIELALASEGLIDDVQELLRRFGIVARKAYAPKKIKSEGKTYDAWRLQIADAPSLLLFGAAIGKVPGKEEACAKIYEQAEGVASNTNWDVVPIGVKELKEIRAEVGPVANKEWGRYASLKQGSCMGAGKFRRLCERYGYQGKYAWLATDALVWERVVEVPRIGPIEVADLTVPGPANVVANGMVIHNTFFASIGICRVIYELSCMKDPQRSFGIATGSTLSVINMCLGGSTEVYDGGTCERRELGASVGRGRTGVFGFDGKAIVPSYGSDVVYTGDLRLYRVTTAAGRQIEATADHKFLDRYLGWTELSNLAKGAIVALAASYACGEGKDVGWTDGALAEAALRVKDEIPMGILQLPRERLAVFMDHLFVRNGMLAFRTGSERLAKDLLFALGRYGIFARTVRRGNEYSVRFEKVLPFAQEVGRGKGVPDIVWDVVVGVEDIGVRPTYCVTDVQGYPWYVANGFITHNSVNELLARKVVFDNIATKIRPSKYFEKEFTFEQTQKEIRFPNNIWLVARATTDTSVLGLNAISAIVDETNFMQQLPEKYKNDKRFATVSQAETIYASIKRRMKSRFEMGGRLPGLLFVVSSKNTQDDFTMQRIRESINDPMVFVRDYALWQVKPEGHYSTKTFFVLAGNDTVPSKILDPGEERQFQGDGCPDQCVLLEVPEDFRSDFEQDLEGATRDIAGIATISVNPYIQRRDRIREAIMLDAKVGSVRTHPYTTEAHNPARPGAFIWEEMVTSVPRRVASGMETVRRPKLSPKAVRHVHIDPSLRGDATGFCMAHVAGTKEVVRKAEDGRDFIESAPVYRVDLILRIVPPVGGELVLGDIRHLVYDLSAHGYEIQEVTLDSYQSADTIQQMKARGYRSDVVSVDLTAEPYDNLKMALYEGRVLMYAYPPLQKELETLQEERRGNRRKIDHPSGGSKDCADALAACLYTLSKRAHLQPLPFISQNISAPDPWLPEHHQAALAAQAGGSSGASAEDDFLPPFMVGDWYR